MRTARITHLRRIFPNQMTTSKSLKIDACLIHFPNSAFRMDLKMTDDDENIRITESDLPQEFILKLLGRYEAKGLWGIKHTREPVDIMVRYAKTHELSLPIVQLVVTREGLFMSPIQCRLDNQSRQSISIRKISSRYQSDRRFLKPDIHVNETWNDDGIAKPELKPCNIAQTVLKQMRENHVDAENKRTVKKQETKRDENFNCFQFRKTEEKKWTPTDLQLLEKYSRFDWRKMGIFYFSIDSISYGVQDLIYTRVFSMIVVSDRNKKNGNCGNSPFMCHAFVCESRSTARRVTYALAAAFQAYGKSMKFLREDDEKRQKRSHEEKPKKFAIQLRAPFDAGINDSEA